MLKPAPMFCAFSSKLYWSRFLVALLFSLLPRTASLNAVAVFREKPVVQTPLQAKCTTLYAGFVGALESSNRKGSGVVQIRNLLRGTEYPDVCANSFIPISWTSGRDWLLSHFPSHSGPLSPEELAKAPRIIMVGHSTGGWAMLSVARDLRKKNIPVELTIQIDSVGITDYTVPKNVKYSAIFHAWDALVFMTTRHVKFEDPKFTTMVADVLVKDASHLSITQDPRIRELVLNSVKTLRAEQFARTQAIRSSAPGAED